MNDVLFWAAAVPVIAFPLVYAVAARWWRTSEGRYNMSLALALLALVALGVLRRTFGSDYQGKEAAQLAVYVFVALVLWWRLVLLVRVQVAERLRRSRVQ